MFPSIVMITMITVTLSCAFYTQKANIPPVPTLPWVKRKIIKILQKHIGAETPKSVVELGSGWGGLAISVLKKYPKFHITGYEISYFPYMFSLIRAKFHPSRLAFKRDDFFEHNLGEYDVVICYLSPAHMIKLEPKFLNDLKPGTLVISNAFQIKGWKPIDVEQTNILMKIPIYVYKIGQSNPTSL